MTPLIVKLTSPVFSKVTFWVLVVCRGRLPKLSIEGETWREAMTFSPTPESETEARGIEALD